MDLFDRARLEELFEQNLSEIGAIVNRYGGEEPTAQQQSIWIDDAMRAGDLIAELRRVAKSRIGPAKEGFDELGNRRKLRALPSVMWQPERFQFHFSIGQAF